jgi:hypothetical protein
MLLGLGPLRFMVLFGFYRSKHVRRRTPKEKKLARFDRIFAEDEPGPWSRLTVGHRSR